MDEERRLEWIQGDDSQEPEDDRQNMGGTTQEEQQAEEWQGTEAEQRGGGIKRGKMDRKGGVDRKYRRD